MDDGFTRREMIGATALAVTLTGTSLQAKPVLIDAPRPRRRERLERWRFHLGHAADVEKYFGFGRDQRTFAKAGQSAEAAMPKFDDSGWAQVLVPHDWAVALPFAAGPEVKGSDRGAAHGFKAIGREFPQNSIGWYRTPINVTAADRGRRILLEFDGVFRDCLVFVNGYAAGRNESGYAPFQVQIGDFLDYDGGQNVVTVRCDATLGEGWFYEGAGIYRHVELVRADPLHIPQWGVVVRSEVGPSSAKVQVATDVLNSSDAPVEALLRLTFVNPGGDTVTVYEPIRFELAPGEQRTFEDSYSTSTAQLWSVENPNLFTLRTELIAADKSRLIDNVETRFGIRTAHFDPERGFFLNGKPVKLLGTANHQDHAGVGSAIPVSVNR